MWYWQDHMSGWGFGGGLVSLILLIAVIALIVWAVISITRGGGVHVGGGTPRREPLEIARERYARGDISREEFEAIKKNLLS